MVGQCSYTFGGIYADDSWRKTDIFSESRTAEFAARELYLGKRLSGRHRIDVHVRDIMGSLTKWRVFIGDGSKTIVERILS